jgi:hypothetical protein
MDTRRGWLKNIVCDAIFRFELPAGCAEIPEGARAAMVPSAGRFVRQELQRFDLRGSELCEG